LHQKLRLHQTTPTSPTTTAAAAILPRGETAIEGKQFNTAVSPKVVLRRKKPIPSTENIQQSVENHFRRSLGSNYKDASISQPPPPTATPPQCDPIVKVKGNIRRRPHSIFVSEEVDRHFERSLGIDAWQVIQAKRAKLARKTWN
jgi:hypothetical protein